MFIAIWVIYSHIFQLISFIYMFAAEKLRRESIIVPAIVKEK